MANDKLNWSMVAARRIHLAFDLERIAPQDTSVPRLAAIVDECCPFKQGVAYMPVPRCDRCRRWDHENVTTENTAECSLPAMKAYVTHTEIGIDKEITIDFQMRTKADFGCVEWERK